LDTVHHLDDVGARLALDIEEDRFLGVHPGGQFGVLRCLLGLGHIRKLYRCAVSIGDHQVAVVGGLSYLIIGVDRVCSARPVEIALGDVDIGIGESGAQIVDVETVGG
jgi:hypothetical protein